MEINSAKQILNGKRCEPRGCLITTLFYVYVNELSELKTESGIWGNLGGIKITLYSDDICIVSLFSSVPQQLLNLIYVITTLNDMI